MSLNERFRIDELVKKGSKAIPRDDRGGIVVRKLDKKEVKPIISKPDKVFGSEPIRDIVEPKLKTDLLEPTTKTEVEQTSFSGETSAYLERPYYDEEQLLKAKDIKVDELIKQKKKLENDISSIQNTKKNLKI